MCAHVHQLCSCGFMCTWCSLGTIHLGFWDKFFLSHWDPWPNDSTRLADQQPWDPPGSAFPELWLHMNTMPSYSQAHWGPNSGPSAYTAILYHWVISPAPAITCLNCMRTILFKMTFQKILKLTVASTKLTEDSLKPKKGLREEVPSKGTVSGSRAA